MDDAVTMVEQRIPDVLSTADLPASLAAEIDFLAGRVDRWCDQSGETGPAIAARSFAALGRFDDARAMLDGFDTSTAPLLEVAAAAWAASRAGGPTVGPLIDRLAAEPGDFLDSDVPAGPRLLFVGMLEAARGDLGAAITALESAVAVGDSRAPLWGALSRLEFGRVMRTAEAVPVERVRRAAPVLTAARAFFAAGGYRSLLEQVDRAGEPVVANLVAGKPATIGFGVTPTVEVRSSKGLQLLRHLVEHAERVVTAAELACLLDGGDAGQIAALAPGEWMTDLESFDGGAAGSADGIRAIFFDETTRSRVTKLIRRTIAKLAESHAPLAAHLDASISTGHACRYSPAGGAVVWRFDI